MRLYNLLEELRPDLVILEVSPMSIFLRRTYGLICRKILTRNIRAMGIKPNRELLDIEACIGLPYEYTAVRDYCRKSGAAFRLADVSIISLARYFHTYKLVTRKNILAAAEVDCGRSGQESGIAMSIFNKNDILLRNMKLSRFRQDRLAVYREKILLRRVRRLVRAHPGERIIYAGGWEHLLDDPENRLLYSGFPLPKKRIITFINMHNT